MPNMFLFSEIIGAKGTLKPEMISKASKGADLGSVKSAMINFDKPARIAIDSIRSRSLGQSKSNITGTYSSNASSLRIVLRTTHNRVIVSEYLELLNDVLPSKTDQKIKDVRKLLNLLEKEMKKNYVI